MRFDWSLSSLASDFLRGKWGVCGGKETEKRVFCGKIAFLINTLEKMW